MISKYNTFWKAHPLLVVMIGALIIRLIAAVFAQGYAMFDDHFLTIEPAQAFLTDGQYNNWLPDSQNSTPAGHSWTYVGIHYYLLAFMESIGIFSPYAKMMIIRVLHAIFSMLIPFVSYKITEKISNKKNALQVAILLSFLWLMPFFSVRNLVEIVCVPFLLLSVWYYLKSIERTNQIMYALLAGVMIGMALSIRFQTSFFVIGFGIAILLKKEFKSLFFIVLASVIVFFLTQGVVDYLIWGRPFAEFQEYINYNIVHRNDYLVAPWYFYLVFLSGILVPPISLFLLFGFFKSYKKNFVIFFASFLFFAFHSYFPNKQERFILSILPFIVMMGIICWNEFVEASSFWKKRTKLLRSFWVFFWILNILVLIPLSITYSKKSRVEAMLYLYNYKSIDYMVVEESQSDDTRMFPRFYSGKYLKYIEITKTQPFAYWKGKLYAEDSTLIRPVKTVFILFIDPKINLESRVKQLEIIYPGMKFECTIEGSFIDKIMQKLNPENNKNQTIAIYKYQKNSLR